MKVSTEIPAIGTEETATYSIRRSQATIKGSRPETIVFSFSAFNHNSFYLRRSFYGLEWHP
jgi:hypothetical protein